ncbi:MAG: DNA polymerase III subunit delta [Bacteroidales bacterium]|nr:DNA polymerase III subunit delta [Lentimicrobiaceae bacterium]MDD5695779.1 DNA polymerase III subunit delta [Bacteroidales bacterium]
MPSMTYDQIRGDLKNNKFYPVYLLTGEESYFIDELADYFEEQIVPDEEKDFNLNVIYGKDTDAGMIMDCARQFPMMAERQVVIVREAQEARNFDELLVYIENPSLTTLLVLCYKYKKLDKRKSLAKAIEKKGVIFESQKVYENKIPDWIRDFIKAKGYNITPKATMMLTEYLGSDLTRIVNEISKLLINIPDKKEVDDALVEKHVGVSKDYNVFELQRALGNRDIFRANQIAAYFASNPKENPLIKVLSILYAFFSKVLIFHQLKDKSRNSAAAALSVSPYFVQDYQNTALNYNPGQLVRIISYLREYDLKSKGVDNVSADDGELLKELVFKILH